MSSASISHANVPSEKSIPEGGASLESILCTEELQRRPSRPPDYEKENRALVKLVSALADSPSTIFQTLAETILDITQCDSAGLSLLTRDGKTPHIDGLRFYWPAICGTWNPHVGGGTPRDFGPCGDVLDQNRSLLFRHFERRYPYLLPVTPAAEECLLVPFYVAGKPVGTIWAIMHSDRRRFDAEDDRIMASLGKLASSAYQAVVHIDDLKIQVAEREKAEAEVRKLASGLEAKIRRLVEANVVGIVMWNLEGAITGANEAFLQMVQYGREELASGHIRWTDLTPAEWRDRDARALTELTKVGTVQPYEKEFFRKDGSRVPVLVGGASFEAGGNEGVAFVLDLSERKRSEERYRIVVETASDAVITADESGLILFANPATKKIFGYDSTELIGRPLTTLMPEFMRKLHEAGFKRYLATGQRHIYWQGTEFTGLRKNGQEFPVEVAFGEIVTESGHSFTGFIRDVSARKRVEENLRRSEQRWRAVFENSAIGVALTDMTGRFLATNSAYQQMLGFSEEELTKLTFLELTLEDNRKRNWGLVAELIDGKRSQFQIEKRYRRKDGRFIWVSNNVSLVPGTEDSPRFVMALAEDITERKQGEKERERLRQAQAELAHINRVSTMGELTASVAHEIKQPMFAAVMDATTCLEWLGRDRPDVVAATEAAERVIKDVTRASEIINRIGSMFKKGGVRRESVNINEIIQQMIGLLRSEAARYSISIHSDLAKDLPKVKADAIQLQQVFMNLMLNGIEATKDIAAPGKLTITSQQDDNRQVLVSVADTGIGLQAEQLEQIFSTFFTSKPQGTGMGLPISRSIIEAHGGRLWAIPNSGTGATFQFTLPSELTGREAA